MIGDDESDFEFERPAADFLSGSLAATAKAKELIELARFGFVEVENLEKGIGHNFEVRELLCIVHETEECLFCRHISGRIRRGATRAATFSGLQSTLKTVLTPSPTFRQSAVHTVVTRVTCGADVWCASTARERKRTGR